MLQKMALCPQSFFKPSETLLHKNYIENIVPRAKYEGARLLDDDFIFQQNNAKS